MSNDDGLMVRLAKALATVRENSVINLDIWLDSHEAGQGGILVLQGAYRKRDLVEINYQSETFPL